MVDKLREVSEISTTPKILLLHGWFSSGNSKKYFLRSLGFDVVAPTLNDWSFRFAVKSAQQAYDLSQPQLIVGSSRGGAVAMNIESGNTPMILLSPAWRRFGRKKAITKRNVVLIHSMHDTMVRYADSQKLLGNSVDGVRLLTGGSDHRLNCHEGRACLKKAIELLLD